MIVLIVGLCLVMILGYLHIQRAVPRLLVAMPVLFIGGCRYGVGDDFFTYEQMYAAGSLVNKEPLFAATAWAFREVGFSFQALAFLCNALVVYCIFRIAASVSRDNKTLWLLSLGVLLIGYWPFTLNGMRQGAATLLVITAFVLREVGLASAARTFFMAIAAVLIHYSAALVILLVLVIKLLRFRRLQVPLAVGMLSAVAIFGAALAETLIFNRHLLGLYAYYVGSEGMQIHTPPNPYWTALSAATAIGLAATYQLVTPMVTDLNRVTFHGVVVYALCKVFEIHVPVMARVTFVFEPFYLICSAWLLWYFGRALFVRHLRELAAMGLVVCACTVIYLKSYRNEHYRDYSINVTFWGDASEGIIKL